MATSPGQERTPLIAAPRNGRSADGALRLPHEMLAGIVSTAPVGIAVFEDDRGCVYVNGYGRRLLGARSRAEAARAVDLVGRSPGPLGQRWPGLEFREILSAAVVGQHIITFQHAAPQLRPEHRMQGLSWAIADMAESGSLVETLDAIASEVKNNLHLAAANIVLHGDADVGYVDVLGGAGFSRPSAERFADMQSCDALGAEFKHREALRARRLVVVPHRYESVMRDPRWAPSHESLAMVDWDGFAAAPLESRGRVVGTLSAFYPSGLTPAAQAEVERLAAVADQAAMAVDNAGLLDKTRRWAVAQERNRLGRELHDAIVQDVFSLAVHSRTIQVSAETGDPADVERIRAGAAELIELSRSALTALRALIFELRPPALQDHSLIEAVRAYAASMSGRSGVPITVLDERADTALPEVASDNIYRVVQESLHNVVRHAEARKVTVSFRDGASPGAGAEVVVEIADDGRGFNPGLVGEGHLGLITMRERAEDLGGCLEVRSQQGNGTRVILRVPTPEPRTDPSPGPGPSPGIDPLPGIGQQG
ncbi:MAG TPA: GAF domain-containing sensor histidine kinase [Trebonia sp.]|jgi:signal transduction histidine kinase